MALRLRTFISSVIFLARHGSHFLRGGGQTWHGRFHFGIFSISHLAINHHPLMLAFPSLTSAASEKNADSAVQFHASSESGLWKHCFGIDHFIQSHGGIFHHFRFFSFTSDSYHFMPLQ
jgi:hypothetical protein